MSTSDRRHEDDLDRDEDPLNEDEQCERTVLHMLHCDETHSLWSLDEIAAAFKERGNATDAVARLAERGLVHRIGEFVFPTLAARYADRLGGESM